MADNPPSTAQGVFQMRPAQMDNPEEWRVECPNIESWEIESLRVLGFPWDDFTASDLVDAFRLGREYERGSIGTVRESTEEERTSSSQADQ